MAQVIFIGNAKSRYPFLRGSLLKSVDRSCSFIAANPFYGDNIPKRLMPKQYNVANLWRVELAHFWRMLYTIKGNDQEVVCFVVDILSHKEYDRVFGY